MVPAAQEGSREGLRGLMLLSPTGLLGTPADEPLPMFSLLGPGCGGRWHAVSSVPSAL